MGWWLGIVSVFKIIRNNFFSVFVIVVGNSNEYRLYLILWIFVICSFYYIFFLLVYVFCKYDVSLIVIYLINCMNGF